MYTTCSNTLDFDHQVFERETFAHTRELQDYFDFLFPKLLPNRFFITL